jgi:hypothetical protein
MWEGGFVLGRLSSREHGGRMRTPAERSKTQTPGCQTVVACKFPCYFSALGASRENIGRGGRMQNCFKKKKKKEEAKKFFQGMHARGKLAWSSGAWGSHRTWM